MDIGHKRPANIPLEIRKQELMLKLEVDIVIRPDAIPPITEVNMLDCCLFQEILLLAMR